MHASHNHYLYVSTKPTESLSLRRTGDIQVGNIVMCHGNLVNVEEISETLQEGLFNPIVKGGKIVVNGIQASCYTHGVAHPLLQHIVVVIADYARAVLPNSLYDTYWYTHDPVTGFPKLIQFLYDFCTTITSMATSMKNFSIPVRFSYSTV